MGLDGFFSQPVGNIQIRFNFAALVTMLERLFGLIIGFTEGMFGIPHCFVDDFQWFRHGSNSFLGSEPSVKDANGRLRDTAHDLH